MGRVKQDLIEMADTFGQAAADLLMDSGKAPEVLARVKGAVRTLETYTTPSEELSDTERLARAYTAANACNLRAILRKFVEDADVICIKGSPDELQFDDRAVLILWFDIVANILGRPSQSLILDCYAAGREAKEQL